jgi:hypothetical protein
VWVEWMRHEFSVLRNAVSHMILFCHRRCMSAEFDTAHGLALILALVSSILSRSL